MQKATRILVFGLMIPILGCSTSPPPAKQPSPFGPAQSTNFLPPTPKAEDRQPLIAVFGQTLLVPASAILGSTGRIPQAKLDDGREVPITIRRATAEAFSTGQSFGSLESIASRWVGPVGRINETTGAGVSQPGASTIEFCEVGLPPDAIGHWLWIGDKHIDLAWIPAEKPLKFEIPELSRAARSDPLVLECLRLEGMSPFTRWRSALFGLPAAPTTLAPVPFALDSLEPVARPDPPTISDLLAARQSAMWNHALLRLLRADASLYRRVLVECTRVVRLSGATDRFAPAWADAADSQALLDALLSNRDTSQGVIAAATNWLSRRPPACAWVSDDAGLLDTESRMPLPRIGLANLSGAPALGWAGGRVAAQSPELISIPPDRAQIVAIPALALSAGNDDGSSVEAHVGVWSTRLAVNRRSLAARPPGLLIAPTFLDLTISSWTRSQTLSPVPTGDRSDMGALAARLVREAGPTNVPTGSGWSIYLEVERSTFEHQTIRIWYGPIDRPTQVVQVELPETSRIPESGEAVATVREAGTRDSLLPGAQIVPSAGHWSLRLPVPNRAVERPGLVRFGVEHVRGNIRSSWPRAVFPWSTEPARACVDLTKW
ncbi:MAG: hypothetical protein KF691_12045 [Phycisphaeraceae bacterium]|nr:hypothetical protein [Phycisphaeraceae bacterium]